MAAALTNFFSYSSPSSSLHCSGHRRTSLLSYSLFRQSGIPAPTAARSLRCFSSDGRRRGGDAEDSAAKEAERISDEKRRSDLAARIASGEFTVPKSGFVLVPFLLIDSVLELVFLSFIVEMARQEKIGLDAEDWTLEDWAGWEVLRGGVG